MLVMMLKRCPVHWHHLTSSCVAQSAKRHNLVTPMSRGGSPKPHGPWITPSDTWKRTCKSCLESGPACRPSTPDWAWTRRACCLYAWLYRALVVALLLSVLAVSLTLPSNAAWAQSNAPGVEARALAERLNFFRWLEDYSDVSEAQRAESFYARIKRIPLVSEQPYPYLSLGGNYRFRYEYYSNELFGLVSPEETTVGLQRFLLHGDLHLQDSIRVFVQLGAYVETGRPGGARPTDESAPDLQQAFVDMKFGPALIRLGRQEIVLGSGLFTGIREGPNQRRSFDAARGTFLLGKSARADVFYAQEVQPDDRAFRDSPVDGSRFWGIYGSNVVDLGERAFFDFFYFGLDRDGSVYNQGVGDEVRHTLGIWMHGGQGAWTYDYHALFQFGTFESQDILAWALLTANYYTFQNIPWQPRVGLRANIGSGERHPRDGVLETFEPLFPNPSYLTEAAIYYPRNLYELRAVMDATPHKTVKLNMGMNFLWRFSRDDAIYVMPGVPLFRGQASDAWFTGYLFDLGLRWSPSPHVLCEFSYVHLGAGNAIRDVGGMDTDFFLISVEARF
jgi:hypothetical protein